MALALTFEELKSFLLGKEIAKYKLPERLEIMADFPLSAFGKVSKKKLAEIVSKKHGTRATNAARHTRCDVEHS